MHDLRYRMYQDIRLLVAYALLGLFNMEGIEFLIIWLFLLAPALTFTGGELCEERLSSSIDSRSHVLVPVVLVPVVVVPVVLVPVVSASLVDMTMAGATKWHTVWCKEITNKPSFITYKNYIVLKTSPLYCRSIKFTYINIHYTINHKYVKI